MRPRQGEANKGQRQELVRYLVGQAKRQGYLLVTPETPKLATDYFRHWCKQALRPAITVELRGACATVIADTGLVGTGLEAQGKLWRGDPWPTLASAPDLQAQLTRLAEHYLSRSPYQAMFSEWGHHEFPELAAVFRLAYWTLWASSWAKENHMRGIKAIRRQALYEQRRERWYARKDEALRMLASSSYARIAFYREKKPGKDRQ